MTADDDARLAQARELLDSGQAEKALGPLRALLKQNPSHAEAWNLRGVARFTLKRYRRAVEAFGKALALEPDKPLFLSNWGEALRRTGRAQQALPAVQRAVVLEPHRADFLNNLGLALSDLGDHKAARQAFDKALSIKPDYAHAWSNLGNLHKSLDDFSAAEAAYEKALHLDPTFGGGHVNLALLLRDSGRRAEARQHFNQAIALDPLDGNARAGLSLLDLLEGDFERGWAGYEYRWQTGENKPRRWAMPAWNGRDTLKGKRLLIYAEQGLGDTLQFCRYLPRLLAAGAELLVEVQAPLLTLLRNSFPQVAFHLRDDTTPQADFQAALLSLPGFFHCDLTNLPRSVPYLTPTDDAKQRWAARLPSSPDRLKVGLAWAGSPTHRNDRLRSLDPALLVPLSRVSGLDFYSLQVGPRSLDTALWPADCLTDLSAQLTDFNETAAAVQRLDLVIAVDTSVVHLAGALAKDTWVLLAVTPDWRWLLERSDSPWYPTMRLFRQQTLGDWQQPINSLLPLLRQEVFSTAWQTARSP